MKRVSEHSPKTVGIIGCLIVTTLVIGALQYKHLPFFNNGNTYSAYFAEAGGLSTGAPVQVAGFRVGDVTDVRLDGPRVLVIFTVATDIRLGDRTEAAIKTKSLLGARMLEISPRGEGALSAPIPLTRTTAPYELPQALGELTKTVKDINTTQLDDALNTVAEAFKDTPANLQLAVNGLGRFSAAINKRDNELRGLLKDANKVTTVLRDRTDQIVSLVANSNDLLTRLESERDALAGLASHISLMAQQISGTVTDTRTQLKPAVEKLNGVLTMIDRRKEDLKKSIYLISKFSLSLGEAVAAGPFFRQYVVNLLPGQFIQPFIDAAFSDLGLDPATALPSQLTDPQVGQRATPPLPIPYPRTGQGGPPRQTLPDAITGNPDDPRYPPREEPLQPAPGGPPPGPPAGFDPNTPRPHNEPTLIDLTPTAVPPAPRESP